jgi:ElaB/YqjD/DUF883 family membrane-anchored ribosome-binding protein
MSRSTHEIERDVERTRSDIEDTVEALREKMSVGQIVDEASRYLRHSGGSEAMSNLAAQAKANPMPLALVGIGLAWLMSGRGQPAIRSYVGSHEGYGAHAGDGSSFRNVGSRLGETAGSAKDAVSGTGRKAGEAVSSRMHQAGDAASQTYGRVSDKASETYGRMSEHASDTYDRMSDRAGRAQRSISELVESEPLILAGLGIALGAAIGAMMPATRTEERLMGDKLDEWKDEAADMARSEWEKTKSVARDAASAAQAEVEKGGKPGDTAERAAKSASQTAEQSARDKGLGSSARKS